MARKAPEGFDFVYSCHPVQVGADTEDRQERLRRKPVSFAHGGRS